MSSSSIFEPAEKPYKGDHALRLDTDCARPLNRAVRYVATNAATQGEEDDGILVPLDKRTYEVLQLIIEKDRRHPSLQEALKDVIRLHYQEYCMQY